MCTHTYIHTHICMYVFWHFPPSASSGDTQKLSGCSKRDWHPDLSICFGRFLSFLWEFYFCGTLFFWALRFLESFAAAARWGLCCPLAEKKRQPWDSKRLGELAGGQDSPVQAVAIRPGDTQGYRRPSKVRKKPETGRNGRPWGQCGGRAQPKSIGLVKAARRTLRM